MENLFNQVLSEEQMAAYLDGMLSTEESCMVEQLIESIPEMAEIQDAIDSVDSTFIDESNGEIPIECMADDFTLPIIDYEFHHSDISYDSEGYIDGEDYHEGSDYQDDSIEMSYQYDSLESEYDNSFSDNEFEDMSF